MFSLGFHPSRVTSKTLFLAGYCCLCFRIKNYIISTSLQQNYFLVVQCAVISWPEFCDRVISTDSVEVSDSESADQVVSPSSLY